MTILASDVLTHGTIQGLTAYSANWTYLLGASGTNLEVTSTGLACIAAGVQPAFNNTVSSSLTDQWAQATITATQAVASAGIGLTLRATLGTSNADNFYYFFASGTNYSVGKYVAGTQTILRSQASNTFNVNDVIYFQIIGTTLTVQQNGSTLGATITDGSLSAGSPGVCGSGNNADKLSTWSAGNFQQPNQFQYTRRYVLFNI